jgi:hypothetical protein
MTYMSLQGIIGAPVLPKGPTQAKPGPKGALARGMAGRRKLAGPLQTVRVSHATDGADLEVQIQAVVKKDMGHGATVYVLLHVATPT